MSGSTRRSSPPGCAGPARATFSLLCADCEATLEVVARFLALLELYREGLVAFVQEQALEELTVRWTGPADGDTELHVDEYAGTPADPERRSPNWRGDLSRRGLS